MKMQGNILKWFSWTVIGAMALLPFHAFLTTWAGSNFGHLNLFRIWKELIIFGLAFPCLIVAYKTPRLKHWLKTNWLPRLILLYVILHLILGVWAYDNQNVTASALIHALLINLRYFGFFCVVVVLATKTKLLEKNWWKVLLVPAAVVVAFGLLQVVLPIDFLKHFGYGPDTIAAFQTIDQKFDYQRIQSTLRGANPLGAYLILVIVAVLAWTVKKRTLKYAFGLASVAALFLTYSRSAWLGVVVAVLGFLFLNNKIFWLKHKKQLLYTSTVVLALAIGSLVAFRNVDWFQNTVFHSDENSKAALSSNTSRFNAMKYGFAEAVFEPLGRGPGTAGPASVRNHKAPRIAENYYIQIAQEVGWLGLALFGLIWAMLISSLWQARQNTEANVLLAVVAGLALVNFVSHAWTDDTISLLMLGLIAIIYAKTVIMSPKSDV